MKQSRISDCLLINIPKISGYSGSISVIERMDVLPFHPQRIFYIYDIPGGESRGAHSHKKCHQFIIAASGSFDVELDDGQNKKTISLNRPYFGIHILPGIWAHEFNFSSGSICLVLTSNKYDKNDYIRDYNEFLCFRTNLSTK